MASKDYDVDGIGRVAITKRANARHIRISLAADGTVKVSLPQWSPYRAGLDFVQAQRGWIQEHQPAPTRQLPDQARIGKEHFLQFESAALDKVATRLTGPAIRIIRPNGIAAGHPDVQQAARKAAIRALRRETEALLPDRLRNLASQFGFQFGTVGVKQLKGRWGSCDSHQDITLNLFLMQLPWPLIDYVLLHELVHTKHMNHGAGFWQEFERCEPRARHFRRLIKLQRPELKAMA